jgi:hypothetical protein
MLRRQLAATGDAARIPLVLRRGGYRGSFAASTAGRLMITWHARDLGAHDGNPHAVPALIAAGQATFPGSESQTIRIALSRQGRRILRRVSHVRVTAEAKFAPVGTPPITTSARFTLTR